MRLGTGARLTARSIALAYLGVLVVLPVAVILWRAFGEGIGAFVASVTTPAAISAFNLSVLIVAIVVPVNVVFGNRSVSFPMGGGVRIEPKQALESSNLLKDELGVISQLRQTTSLKDLGEDRWWWD